MSSQQHEHQIQQQQGPWVCWSPFSKLHCYCIAHTSTKSQSFTISWTSMQHSTPGLLQSTCQQVTSLQIKSISTGRYSSTSGYDDSWRRLCYSSWSPTRRGWGEGSKSKQKNGVEVLHLNDSWRSEQAEFE